MISRCHC